MNKIININLGGYPFTIDDNAYFELEKYLNTIRRHFSKSEGCDDIISDIESRMAELLNEGLKGRSIINMSDIEKVIAIMGRPDEFGAETEEAFHEHKTRSSEKTEFRTGKRLFRDTDEKVIGGVCAGLSSYFGIEEPVWIRLCFAISLFAGFGVIAYIILWIAIPEAKTSADKLSMKGEKIDVSSIAKKVEEEINNLSRTINEMVEDISSKKKV